MDYEQDGYYYFECPDCEFTSILERSLGSEAVCPLCIEDNGHMVPMKVRIARSSDHAEGTDARPSVMRP